LQAKADLKFAALAIAQSEKRLIRLQARADALEVIRAERAAAAEPGIPGDRTGLILKRRRSYKVAKDEYREVTDCELDTALLLEERAIDLAAARETGEWLAQTGRGAFGAGAGGAGPLVVVLSSGLQPIPGDAPGAARHRITDPRRIARASAAEVEGHVAAGIPLDLIDIESPGPALAVEDTREQALPGIDGEPDTDDAG
jgi:hypothetical protein